MAFDIWVGMLRNCRVGSAMFIAVFFGGFLVWWKPWGGDPGPLVAERDASAEIAQVHPNGLVIQLDSGQTVRTAPHTKTPAGTKVQLKVTAYRSGSEVYELPYLDLSA